MKESNQSKVSAITLNKELEELRNKVLFPEKLAIANKILNKAGLPQKTTK
jgi:hypothetical protein